MTVNGFVNINKPQNMTSSDVVVKVRGILRRVLGERPKVGHLGTLDPMATGVLPIAVGKTTRLFDLMQEKRKTYIAKFKFGIETDTLDVWGKQTATADFIPTEDDLKAVIPSLTGKIEQYPPLYSAKSINGKRAYDLAREGKQFEIQPKTVEILEIELLGGQDGEYSFKIVCGSGTYIRAIARDMASLLNTKAIMTELNRIESGNFTIQDSITIEEFEKNPLDYILPIDKGLCFEKFELPSEDLKKILNGVATQCDFAPGEPFFATIGGEIIGIANKFNGYINIQVRLK